METDLPRHDASAAPAAPAVHRAAEGSSCTLPNIRLIAACATLLFATGTAPAAPPSRRRPWLLSCPQPPAAHAARCLLACPTTRLLLRRGPCRLCRLPASHRRPARRQDTEPAHEEAAALPSPPRKGLLQPSRSCLLTAAAAAGGGPEGADIAHAAALPPPPRCSCQQQPAWRKGGTRGLPKRRLCNKPSPARAVVAARRGMHPQ